MPDLEFGRSGEYLTDRLTDEALRVIEYAQKERRPFFLILAHHAPHTPIQAKPEDIDDFRQRLRPDFQHQHPVYAAMVRSLDQSAGRIMNCLDQHDFTKQTLLIFTSDNGGYLGTTEFEGKDVAITSNWPLRSGKGTLYEGGLRVPLLFRWPGTIESAKVVDRSVVLTDLFPTISDIVNQQRTCQQQVVNRRTESASCHCFARRRNPQRREPFSFTTHTTTTRLHPHPPVRLFGNAEVD